MFVHPAIFWIGLGAVGVPILIHLLNRRRFRLQDWAAMRFVREAFRRQRRRLQIEQLILLAIRCLAVLLLGLALARFAGCGAMAVLPGADATRATAFILDDSVSMGQRFGGGSAFDLAKADLVEQLGALGDGETVVIRRASDPADAPLFPMGFVTDRPSLVAKIGALEPTDVRSDLAATLEPVAGGLLAQPGAKRLVILSDIRAADLGADRAEALKAVFGRLIDGDVDVLVMDYGREATGNLTAVSLELADKFIVTGAPARVAAVVRNNGPETVRDVEVDLAMRLPPPEADAEPVRMELPSLRIDAIEPGGRRRAEFEVTAPAAGPMVISASLPADELDGDNTVWLAVTVRNSLRVLAVDGHLDPTDPTAGEAFTFAMAVDPSGSAQAGVAVDVVGPGLLGTVALSDYDAVALLNVAELPSEFDAEGRMSCPQLIAMVTYVREGGGLLIATGHRANLSFYNGPLLADGAGLSPFRIGPPVGDAAARERFVRLDPESIDPTHPVVRTFAGPGGVLTGFIRVFAFTPTEEIRVDSPTTNSGDPPHVLARFTDDAHSPAIVSRAFGRGRVIMVYSTMSTGWNDWADDQPPGIYVGPVQDLVRALARSRAAAAGPRVGQTIVYTPPEGYRDAEGTLKAPSFPASDLTLLRSSQQGRTRTALTGPTEAGVYTLWLRRPDGRGTGLLMARNVDPAEGNLIVAGREKLRGALGSDTFTYVPRSESQKTAVFGPAKSELWLWLLLTAVALLAAETVLAQRFGHYTISDAADGDGGAS